MDLYKYFASPDEVESLKAWYLRGIGWGDAKNQLFEVINRELKGPRQKFEYLMKNTAEIEKVLKEGAERVRPWAAKNLERVKKAVGVL